MAGKAVAIMDDINRLSCVAVGAVAFWVSSDVTGTHGGVVDLRVWSSRLADVADGAITAAGVGSGAPLQGAILVMTRGAAEPAVHTIDQIGISVADDTGGGGGYLCGVRGGGRVDIEIGVAIHAVTRAMGEGRALEQTGRRGMADAATPVVGI